MASGISSLKVGSTESNDFLLVGLPSISKALVMIKQKKDFSVSVIRQKIEDIRIWTEEVVEVIEVEDTNEEEAEDMKEDKRKEESRW